MRPIYLDYNTTTPIAPRVQEAMLPFLAEHFQIPGSPGSDAVAVRQAIDDARQRVRSAIAATDTHRLAFTSGPAASCRQAMSGVVEHWAKCDYGDRCHLVVSGVEHPRVSSAARFLQERRGVDVSQAPCDESGVVRPEGIADAIRDETAMVCVAHADEVTGVVQPVAEIAEVCRECGTLLHVDASVSFGKVATDVEHLAADLLTLSGRHVYAPTGVGVLYARDSAVLEPGVTEYPFGGDDPGSDPPCVPAVIGIGHAAELASATLQDSSTRLAALRDRLELLLVDALGEEVTPVGGQSPRLPNTSLLKFGDYVDLQVQGDQTDLCVPFLVDETTAGSRGRTRLLGKSALHLARAVRVSLGWYTTEEEIDRAASLLIDAWERAAGR